MFINNGLGSSKPLRFCLSVHMFKSDQTQYAQQLCVSNPIFYRTLRGTEADNMSFNVKQIYLLEDTIHKSTSRTCFKKCGLTYQIEIDPLVYAWKIVKQFKL